MTASADLRPHHDAGGHTHRATAGERPGGGSFAGTLLLARFILRRDRLRMAVWAASITAFVAYFAVALSTVFDAKALAARAEIMRTPAGIVMGGPGYGVEDYSPLVAVANEGTLWITVSLSLMAILHVVRHTRGEEEGSRAEMVRASAIGAQAPALATFLTLLGHLALITVLGAAATLASSVGDSFVDGLAMMAGASLSALVLGTVALVTAQLSGTARGASGIAMAVLGIAVAVRSAGDMIELHGSLLSWFSPIAWAQQVRAFVDLRWWPMLLSVGAIIVLLVIAAALSSRRDIGQGLLASRAGRAEAPASLRGPVALALRQQRGTILWCATGMGALWFATGTLMRMLDEMAGELVADNPTIGAIFGSDPTQMTSAFLSVMMLFIALCVAAFGIVSTHQHCRREETSGLLEQVLAGPVSRHRWLGAQLLVSLGGSLVLLATSVAALWIGTLTVGLADPSFADHATTFLVYAPATLVFPALSAALYGWLPRLSGLSWLLVAAALVSGMFGQLLDLPEWTLGISPFHGVPDVYAEGRADLDAAGPLRLLAVVIALVALSFWGFRRRAVTAAG